MGVTPLEGIWCCVPVRRFSIGLGTLEVRLSADLLVHESDRAKVVFLNCRQDALDGEYARRILEIGHWVLESNGAGLSPRDLELLDLASGSSVRISRRRKSTIRKVEDNVQVIGSLWETI